MVRGRVLSMHNENDNSPNVSGTKVELKDKIFPEVDISYFFTKSIAAELILTYPQKHDVLVNGGKVGSLKHLPPTLLVQYHFMPDSTFRPYVGIGYNYTIISSVELAPGLDVGRSSHGPAFQLGADIKMASQWFFNIDVKKVYIKTDVSSGGSKLTTLKLDPVLASVGVGYRF